MSYHERIIGNDEIEPVYNAEKAYNKKPVKLVTLDTCNLRL